MGKIKKMLPWHETLIVLKADTTLTVTEIAAKLKKSRNTIYVALNDKRIKKRLNDRLTENVTRHNEIRDEIIKKAYTTIKNILFLDDEDQNYLHLQGKIAIDALKGLGEFTEKIKQEIEQRNYEIKLPEDMVEDD